MKEKPVVFDTRLVIKDMDGFPSVNETLSKLDEMLNFYDVDHCFTLPFGTDFDNHPTAMVTLFYNEEDDMLLSLVYALFSKVYRHCDDKSLGGSLAKIARRHAGSGAAKEAQNDLSIPPQEYGTLSQMERRGT